MVLSADCAALCRYLPCLVLFLYQAVRAPVLSLSQLMLQASNSIFTFNHKNPIELGSEYMSSNIYQI